MIRIREHAYVHIGLTDTHLFLSIFYILKQTHSLILQTLISTTGSILAFAFPYLTTVMKHHSSDFMAWKATMSGEERRRHTGSYHLDLALTLGLAFTHVTCSRSTYIGSKICHLVPTKH